jgi:hypothetical protein
MDIHAVDPIPAAGRPPEGATAAAGRAAGRRAATPDARRSRGSRQQFLTENSETFQDGALNVTNALFLTGFENSFAGTHYANPREVTGQVKVRFHY